MYEEILFTEEMLYKPWKPPKKPRKDGRYVCQIKVEIDRTVKPHKKIYKHIYADNIVDLQMRRAAFIKEKIKEQSGKIESKESLTSCIEDWMYNYKFNKIKRTSFDRLEEVYENNVRPFLYKIPHSKINEITKEDINTLLNCVKNKGYSYSTYKKTFNFYTGFFSYLIEEDKIFKNPVKNSLLINKDKYKEELFFIHQERETYRSLVLNKGKLSKNDLFLLNKRLKLKLTDEEIDKGKDNGKDDLTELTVDELARTSKENREYSSEDLKYLSKKFGVDVNQRFAEIFFSTLKMEDKEEIDYLSSEELKAIVNVVENGFQRKYTTKTGKEVITETLHLKDTEFILFMILTGIRVGEAAALRYKDVDFEHKKITITNNATVRKNRDVNGKKTAGTSQVVSTTKTQESKKTIPVSAEAIYILEKLKEKEPEGYDGYIVHNGNNPVRDSALRKRFKNLLRSAGVKERNIHVTRHTFASLMFEATKGDSKTVSSLLRHSSTAITEDIYVHLSEKYKENVVESIKLLSSDDE